jgi:hypothetical protein
MGKVGMGKRRYEEDGMGWEKVGTRKKERNVGET